MASRADVVRCHIVAYLLISDGQLTDDEYEFVYAFMRELGLTEQEQQEVVDSTNVDDEVEQILTELDDDARLALVEDLRAAAAVDGATSAVEAEVIDRVRRLVPDPE